MIGFCCTCVTPHRHTRRTICIYAYAHTSPIGAMHRGRQELPSREHSPNIHAVAYTGHIHIHTHLSTYATYTSLRSHLYTYTHTVAFRSNTRKVSRSPLRTPAQTCSCATSPSPSPPPPPPPPRPPPPPTMSRPLCACSPSRWPPASSSRPATKSGFLRTRVGLVLEESQLIFARFFSYLSPLFLISFILCRRKSISGSVTRLGLCLSPVCQPFFFEKFIQPFLVFCMLPLVWLRIAGCWRSAAVTVVRK